MSADNLVQQLHNKATRGEPLSAEEKAQLEQWYARLDREESEMLSGTSTLPEIATLQAQVEDAVAQLVTTAQSIQALTAENEAVRREIADLKQQLAQKYRVQPA
jgi:predicted  nucleic acid-binding Zn-ribbon protein